MKRMFWIPILALGVWSSASAQQQASAPTGVVPAKPAPAKPAPAKAEPGKPATAKAAPAKAVAPAQPASANMALPDPAAGSRKAAGPTAPGNATYRSLDEARVPVDEGGAVKALPQVAIPLGRGNDKPVALQPGKSKGTAGSVDDADARCLAQADPAARAKCAPK